MPATKRIIPHANGKPRRRPKKTAERSAAQPPGQKKSKAKPGRARRLSRPSRVSQGCEGVVENVAQFISNYLVLPPGLPIVVSAWTVASWLAPEWDRFPHLGVFSPEKRCGKTLLLRCLELLLRNPRNTASASPASIYRLIDQRKGDVSLLLDEAQSLDRDRSESSDQLRELFNAGIDRNATVLRCVGKNHQVKEFSVYCPKVIAKIGDLDGVLADRSLPVRMERKTHDYKVERFLLRAVEPIAEQLKEQIETWVEHHRDDARAAYDVLGPFDIENDRMAELLLPLQAVMTVDGNDDNLDTLSRYAKDLDQRDQERETQSPGVRLLAACRELFIEKGKPFIGTEQLLRDLIRRSEEPWATWRRGEEINAEGLARLLRPYGIRSDRDTKANRNGITIRGYYQEDFEDAWARYCGPTPDTLQKPD